MAGPITPYRNNKECYLLRRRLVDSVFPQWLSSKESACEAEGTGDTGSIPGLRRYPGRGHGNPLQYSCLENPTDRGAWWAIVHGVENSQA